MLRLTLTRIHQADQVTIGVLHELGDPAMYCYTLEDPVRDQKIPNVTAIPTGSYRLGLRMIGGMHARYSERFGSFHKGMVWLQDVPDFSFVYAHIGNRVEDTEGCILLGSSHQGRSVLNSESAYRKVYPSILQAIETDGAELIVRPLG